MITSSHNPAEWNGVKYKASYGGSGNPSIMTTIESYLGKALPKAEKPAVIEEADFHAELRRCAGGFCRSEEDSRVGLQVFDRLHVWLGARGDLRGYLSVPGFRMWRCGGDQSGVSGDQSGADYAAYRGDATAVVAEKCDAGLITDGDADRIGAVDEHGNVVDAHKILALLTYWLLERKKWPGDVTRAFNTTKMMDRIAAKYGRRLHEHGIGFKYVVDLMLEHEILIGGEESGGVGISRHLPERDGLLNSLLIANVMADEKKTLGQLVAALQEEFGEHQYGRVDMHINEELKQSAIARAKAGVAEIAGMKVLRVETLDGIKFFLENADCAGKKNAAETWLLLRASGTEPLLRVYCESCSTESVAKVLAAARGVCAAGERWLSEIISSCFGAKGILFDMDGVLISSIGSVLRCWKRWAEMYGVPDPQSFEFPHGRAGD